MRKKVCLPFLRFIGDAVMIEGSKHLNPQDSIQEQEEEQKYGHTPNLLPRPPERKWILSGWYGNKQTFLTLFGLVGLLLENVGYAGTRQFKSEVDSEGSDHNEGPRYA